MSLLHLQSHNAMSFNLEHINILFHASSGGSTGLLLSFHIFLFFVPRSHLFKIGNFVLTAICMESESEGGRACHCSASFTIC